MMLHHNTPGKVAGSQTADGLVVPVHHTILEDVSRSEYLRDPEGGLIGEILVIDLDTDVQTCYYGGNLLYSKSWTEGMSGGGVLNIGAVDLFGNGADTVYYDTMSLAPEGATAVEPSSWGKIKHSFR